MWDLQIGLGPPFAGIVFTSRVDNKERRECPTHGMLRIRCMQKVTRQELKT